MSDIEQQMDNLENAFRQGIISEKEYDEALQALIEESNR